MQNPFSTGQDGSGLNSMADPLGFIKKLWGGMNVPGMHLPGMVAPPMTLEELDKKIQDLKTVESWLNVNMNMLRGTIQAMEVQRATIATLHSLGASFASHMKQAGVPATGKSPAAANADWPMSSAAEVPPVVQPAPTPEPEPEPEPVVRAADSGAASSAPFGNPTAWWGVLQDQFKQAVSQAMEIDHLKPSSVPVAETVAPVQAAAAPAPQAAKKRAAPAVSKKPATKPAAAPRAAGKAKKA